MTESTSTKKMADFTADEARKLTDSVKKSFDFCYAHIVELHERRADKALGYANWAEFVKDEFGFSRRYGYHLIHASKMVAQIEVRTGVRVALSEKAMRNVKCDDVVQIQKIASEEVAAGKSPEEAVVAAVTTVAKIAAAAAAEKADTKPRRARPRESIKRQGREEPKNQLSDEPNDSASADPGHADGSDDAQDLRDGIADRDNTPENEDAPDPTPISSKATWSFEEWKDITLACTDRDGLCNMRVLFVELANKVEYRIRLEEEKEYLAAS